MSEHFLDAPIKSIINKNSVKNHFRSKISLNKYFKGFRMYVHIKKYFSINNIYLPTFEEEKSFTHNLKEKIKSK
jgi:hypothetical protein